MRESDLQVSACVFQKKPTTPDLSHFTVDEWELPKEEFSLEEQLGSGYFADVYRGRWKNMIKVAIKILKSGIYGFCYFFLRLVGQRTFIHIAINAPGLVTRLFFICKSLDSYKVTLLLPAAIVLTWTLVLAHCRNQLISQIFTGMEQF